MTLSSWFAERSSNFHYGRGALAGGLAFVLLGANTALIPNPFFVRQIPVVIWDYLFLATTAILAAYYFGLDTSCRSSSDDRYALLGGLAGVFSFACPICNGILLALFSTATIMTYVEPLRPFLGLLATGVLIFLVSRGPRCAEN